MTSDSATRRTSPAMALTAVRSMLPRVFENSVRRMRHRLVLERSDLQPSYYPPYRLIASLSPVDGSRVLIFPPIKKLAVQSHNGASEFGRLFRIRDTCTHSGVPQSPQNCDLADGVEICIASQTQSVGHILCSVNCLRALLDCRSHCLARSRVSDLPPFGLEACQP